VVPSHDPAVDRYNARGLAIAGATFLVLGLFLLFGVPYLDRISRCGASACSEGGYSALPFWALLIAFVGGGTAAIVTSVLVALRARRTANADAVRR
jgi:ABC-type antimicrobial peptide transport system permease subunit